ncbi:hypothetical protein EI555_016706 [Monodon monoceros]|uniref:Uncharacterized protein n=1 Tax=Monodon monoceros TaxID=40151 RepID=A0A4U1FEK3_MONMO|nr:hypothetical protein EI555_016706 [Monodon monoceros]
MLRKLVLFGITAKIQTWTVAQYRSKWGGHFRIRASGEILSAGVAASSGSRALGLWAAHFPSAVFWWRSRWPPSHFTFVHLCPWYLYLAWNTSRGKIREWALSNPRRRRSLSGRTLFSPETLHERNLRALHSVLNRPYRKARRSKPFLMQTGDSGSTKQGYNFYVELMWSRFGAF